MSISMRCLTLTCVLVIGVTSTITPLCPLNWPGNPDECRLMVCNSTPQCTTRFGLAGSCCRTSCGGQNCFFATIKIDRRAVNDLDDPNVCPPSGPWMGQSSKQCNLRECSTDDQCRRNGLQGHCCRTSCGGQNCYFPNESCPGNWSGLNNASCAEHQCTAERNCRQKGARGVCCQTSCGGHNCFISVANYTSTP